MRVAMFAVLAVLLVGCTPMERKKDAIETSYKVDTLATGDLDYGLYRYYDKENGNVIYLYRGYQSSAITSQKMTK